MQVRTLHPSLALGTTTGQDGPLTDGGDLQATGQAGSAGELAYLTNLPVSLTVPPDHARPAQDTQPRALGEVTALDAAALGEALRELCEREGVSPQAVLLAAVHTLLSRYGEQTAGVVGLALPDPGGALDALVPLHADLSGNPSFGNFLAWLHTTISALTAPADRRDSRGTAAWNTAHDAADCRVAVAVLEDGEPAAGEAHGYTACDVTVLWVPGGPAPRLMVVYDTGLYEAATMRRLLGHLRTLLEGAVADPWQGVAVLPLLTEEECRQFAEWNATARPYPRDLCVPQLVAAQAAKAPKAVALVCKERVLTYGELDARANRLAHRLRSLGVGSGTPVALYLERSLESAVGALGILRAGGAYVPLDPAYPVERLLYMLEDTQAPVLVSSQALAARLPRGNRHVVALDGGDAELTGYPTTPPSGHPTPAQLAYIIYTSGSTGRPKGVPVTHDNLLNLAFWHWRTFGVTGADRATLVASPAFDAAVWELWPYLVVGAALHVVGDEVRTSPAQLRDWLVEQRITIGFLPTALAEQIIALPWPATTALRLLLTGGDTLHQNPPATLPFSVINNYGPTECTVVATSGAVPASTAHADRPTIGRPIHNTAAYILDAHLQQVPIGIPGELYIGGAGVVAGYLNRPDLTAERFITRPFDGQSGATQLYRTGDAARYLPDGQIAFLGRTDNQVKVRGQRIEPDEIAAVLGRHPQIQASTVVARQDGADDKVLVAYVVPATATRPSASVLREFLAASLPDAMVPTVFVLLDRLPLTPNGKIDRTALPAPSAAVVLQDAEGVAPRTPTEAQLVEIIASLLQHPAVGVEDNFFLLGGHSLLGTQVVMRIAEVFGVELPLRTIFEAPTAALLAVEIEQHLIAKLEAMTDEEALQLLR